MAKGASAKLEITNKILKTFEGSFLYNDGKEIRIPVSENGEIVQIKVALTCAKVNVSEGEDNALSGTISTGSGMINFEDISAETIAAATAPTEEEKANIANLLASLRL